MGRNPDIFPGKIWRYFTTPEVIVPVYFAT
jgi:hypothetical protein